MSTVPAFPRIVTAMRLVFAFYLVAALVTPLSAPLSAQCTPVTQVPNGTISSGTVCYSNNTDLNAAGVVINGSASASFVAGQSVHLTPGFRATAGTAPTTFHAWVESLPSAVSVAPSTGAGLTRTFDWTVSSPAGIASISQVFALLNTAVSGANACYIRYDRASNTLLLANDAANGWLGGYPLGYSGQSFNAKCSINTQGASVSTSGNQLTLTVPVTFQPAFSGTKNNYLLVYNTEALNSGWQTVGSWTVGTSPPQQYSLTTSTSPAGSGSISPPCPTGCQYPSGTQVQLIATPAAGYQFANFTGSVTGGSPASVTMDSNKNVTATFTQLPQVVAPLFNPATGTYSSMQNVTISTATGGASIRYTVDGSIPSSTIGTLYTGAVPVASTITLRAIAFKSGMADSAVTAATYNITAGVAAPSFSPVGGTYSSGQTVTITSATGGASIRYTTDGATPTSTSGTPYSGPVSVSATTTIKAIAYKPGMSDSSVTSSTYTITPGVVAAPSFTPGAGAYSSNQSVTITSTTSGATIRYTTDGATPTSTSGNVYTGPVSVSGSTTIRAIAYKTGMTDSPVTSASYVIQGATSTLREYIRVGGRVIAIENTQQ